MLVLDARRLRAAIALKGWTQGELAERAGVSAWGLSRMMGGHATLEEPAARAIAKALGCKVTDFADEYVKARGE